MAVNMDNTKLFSRATEVIPGGVNSPVRAFKSVGTRPIFVTRAKGSHIYDVEGKDYIDYCMSWGPMILGHARREVVAAAKAATTRGTSYGISTPLEVELAEMIVQAIPSIEKVRLVSSGTEAVMTALRLARAATGRNKIVKFIGGYHGHVDSMLASAGSGVMTLGIPGSPGVPQDVVKHTVLVPYNDAKAVKSAFARHGKDIAAVIVEPVAGNMGVVLPEPQFLETIRNLCTTNDSVLICDEVITGFRLQYGSAQQLFGIEADLTCLGKIIGGGFPLAACGGKAELMDRLAPQGEVYQAGTLSGNPVCVAAGIATLKSLRGLDPYRRLERLTADLCNRIAETLAAAGIPHVINRAGSMFTVFFTSEKVSDYASAASSDTGRYAHLFRLFLEQGIYLPPSQFEAWFLSVAHSQSDLDCLIEALKQVRW